MSETALVLVDMQSDFLSARDLEPSAGDVTARAARLLEGFRARGLPVVHVHTTVRLDPDDRMPHWTRADVRRCVAGTPGHAPPPELLPRADEPIVEKRFHGGFGAGALEDALRRRGARTVVLAGVYLHGCVRAIALEAYDRGLEVTVASDAVASDDPLHAAVTARWLDGRMARLRSVEEILEEVSVAPAAPDAPSIAPAAPAPSIAVAVETAARAQAPWRASDLAARRRRLHDLARLVEEAREDLAALMVREIGKPVRHARAEVDRAAALVRACAARDDLLEGPCGAGARFRHVPHGVVAVVTPWNNPVAIPLGKIAPALFYGNAVVWKPSPLAAAVSRAVAALLERAGLGAVACLEGDAATARALLAHDRVAAASMTGSPAAGRALEEICARRRIPLHAELGGNNAAIVLPGSGLERAATIIARGAFGFAGQRCTANRRVIPAGEAREPFLAALVRATAALPWGAPEDAATEVGPLVSPSAAERVAALLERAARSGLRIERPHLTQGTADASAPPTCSPAHLAPALVLCDDPAHEVVQEETFGPVLVVQRAASLDEAIRLLNGVRHGLAAALFGGTPAERARFLDEARAGILKLDQATADAGAEAPFGGWKASGIGAPEHGASNREVYTRTQAVYEG